MKETTRFSLQPARVVTQELRTAGQAGQAVDRALSGLADGCQAVVQAQATIVQQLNDSTRSAAYRLEQARATMGGALAVASKSEQVFTSALASGQKQLANRIMPGQPMTFDSTLAAFYASEYVKTLEQTARGAEMLAKVSGLLADAIAQRDSVKQFILTGGMLSTTYDRLGVDPQALYQTLAKTLADGNATRTGPGAELLPYLQQGGSGTLAGLAVAARVAIMRAQADFDAYLSQVTRQYMPGMSR